MFVVSVKIINLPMYIVNSRKHRKKDESFENDQVQYFGGIYGENYPVIFLVTSQVRFLIYLKSLVICFYFILAEDHGDVN